jgi:thioredoxin-related protein
MIVHRILFCALLLGSHTGYTQVVDWISFDSLQEKMRVQPRPVLIYIYTGWCKYCTLQKERTFTAPAVTDKIDRQFYAVSLDAESKTEIIFLNKHYGYKPSRGYHELAELLGKKNGTLSFPTTVILSESLQLLEHASGFLNEQDMSRMLGRCTP